MQVYGRQEQPRILVLGFNPEIEFVQHLQSLAPTVKVLAGGEEMLSTVRQGDYDVVVLGGDAANIERHLFVLQFGGKVADLVSVPDKYQFQIVRGSRTVGTQFAVPEGLPAPVDRLVRQELVPLVMQRAENPTIALAPRAFYQTARTLPPVNSVVHPFLMDLDEKPIAGRYTRPRGLAERWWLPGFVDHPERWFSAALEVWRGLDPERFPGEADWQGREEWQTVEESTLAQNERDLEASKERQLGQINEQLAGLAMRRREASQRADENERRLLTAQGDDLVTEVIATLREFGFDVVDVDAELAVPGDRLEDIRVTDPDVENWIAIAEVRGYAKGAQLNDLLRIQRFVNRYARENGGEEPDAAWYVVNQFLATDPTTRPLPLGANPKEVATFSEGGGLVIDSAQLFKMRSALRRGVIDARGARTLLREAGPRLDFA